jgi:UPF0755 protein
MPRLLSEPPSRDPRSRRTGPGGAMARSPAEALEPTRGPRRPRGRKSVRQVRPMSPMLRAINGFLTMLAFVLVLSGAAVVWFEGEVEKAGPLAVAKTVVVRERESSRDIARRLELEGVISSQHVFIAHYVGRTLSNWSGSRPTTLKAGEYQFEPGQSMASVFDTITKGRALLYAVTIPEGLTSHQVVERLRADPSLTGEVAAIPPEGALMPDTYKVPRGAQRSFVLELMTSESGRFLEKAWATRRPELPVRTVQEALVLASIVEKETGRRDERKRVAAVFVNRLRKGMRLQSDPTILYGLHTGQVQWGRPITRSDIASRTAHNTYQIAALPPTPICNPGRASIEAVLNPASTNDLYFVADGSGGHVFTETLKEHNAAVAKWRQTEREIRSRQSEKSEKEEEAQPPAAGTAPAPGSTGAAPVALTASTIPLPRRKPKPSARAQSKPKIINVK